jgi:alpha-beta hydrolase superfamily lysophospholipase
MAYRFGKPQSRGAIVLFGGFDSYVEELFPMVSEFARRGHDVVAFDGPGQGGMLEDQHVPMTADWHRPVTAVLTALGLDDVTLIGVSLGGCLVIRAAAFEPRVTRVIAFDAMTDFFACMLRQPPPTGAWAMRTLVRVQARWIVNRFAQTVAQRQPVVDWGLGQAMHVFGRATPFDAFDFARAFRSDDISDRIKQDVLLLAGAQDHYVPLSQLWDQARMLSAARSVTCRVFTRADDAQAHCQVGNLPLAIDAMSGWLKMLRPVS